MYTSHYQTLIQQVSGLVSLLVNSFLIFLIVTKSPSQLGAYKYLMIIISIYELAYSALDVIVAPIWSSFGSVCLIVTVTRDRLLPAALLSALNSTFAGCFGFCLSTFALHFIYRYLAMSGSGLLKTFQSWKFVLWFLPPTLVGVVCTVTNHFICGADEERNEMLRAYIQETFGLELSDISYIGSFLYASDENGHRVISKKGLVGFGLYSLLATASTLVLAVFGVKCWRQIRVISESKSAKLQSFQSQLFYALVAQTLIPTALLLAPSAVFFPLILLDADVGRFSELMGVTIAIYPAVDPFPTFFMIRHYRQAMYDYLRLPCKKIHNVSTSELSPGLV